MLILLNNTGHPPAVQPPPRRATRTLRVRRPRGAATRTPRMTLRRMAGRRMTATRLLAKAAKMRRLRTTQCRGG
jgi:hypothetical protein